MNRNKKLLKNTIIYFIGNVSTRLLSFLLLPLYTVYLTPEDYGKVDLLFTYTSIIIPIITLQITFAGFRYLYDTTDIKDQKSIISNTLIVNFFGLSTFILVYIFLWRKFQFEYGLFIILYLLLNTISSTLQQLIRGLRKNELYAIVGVISTIVQLLCNIIFILGLGLRSAALILSPTIAFFVSVLFIIITVKIHKYFDFKLVNKEVINQLLRYSLPLVPDAVCWWLLLGFGRMFLSYSHGIDAVGIYAVANKFPSILTMFYSIFNLAWQENSFSEYNKNDRDFYYSYMLNKLIKFIMPLIIIAIPVTKIISEIFIGKKFEGAYLYIPLLYIGVLISIIATFYGAGFESAKQTKGILVSTLYAMITNILLNIILTTRYSIYGVAIALVGANIVLLISRVKRSKKFFKINIEISPTIIMSILILVVFALHYIDSMFAQLLSIILGIIMFGYYNIYLIIKIKDIIQIKVLKKEINSKE